MRGILARPPAPGKRLSSGPMTVPIYIDLTNSQGVLLQVNGPGKIRLK
jgi:hypothetical protein